MARARAARRNAAVLAPLLRAHWIPRIGVCESDRSTASDDAAEQPRDTALQRCAAAAPPADPQLRRIRALQLEAVRQEWPDRARQHRYGSEFRPPLRRALVHPRSRGNRSNSGPNSGGHRTNLTMDA